MQQFADGLLLLLKGFPGDAGVIQRAGDGIEHIVQGQRPILGCGADEAVGDRHAVGRDLALASPQAFAGHLHGQRRLANASLTRTFSFSRPAISAQMSINPSLAPQLILRVESVLS